MQHPTDVTIEPADASDVDTLAELWVELAADQRRYGSHLLAADNGSRILEAMRHHVATDTAIVARRDGDLVGFVTFGVETGRYRQDAVRGIVHNIYVRDPDRSEGIGSGLLDAAEDALRDMGVDIVALQAMADNADARAFYDRHGYAAHRIELEKPINDDLVTSDSG
ncbi:GNAT family N-acetyltransferase [Natronomonas salsuginis]|uniref:GNAT family N-acetyltransferase n=1 Tax=Natronomonas salsuginis TaxID=2217661 RepID=A0A4V5ZPL6_9EURY|nr:GNAT family N-acetyltransferase [Natronomonas salsuginis]TKR28103.1 GNAT family N-acetyltransferase [Natronomonas salsuginis]